MEQGDGSEASCNGEEGAAAFLGVFHNTLELVLEVGGFPQVYALVGDGGEEVCVPVLVVLS